jgi:isoleucyl-tRNA synthetase
MSNKFREYKTLDLPGINKDILENWKKNNTFQKSIDNRAGKKTFVFYEGPPSANGLPGIHHVMARAIKDIFCRFKTLQGFQVNRKAGWDTHGLPVELDVEKNLGITKDDIGKSISVLDYNKRCREDVMKYKNIWEDLTQKMGYWVNLDDPYITFDNRYIETVWYLLKQLYDKDLLYKGYTIQPYSPAAGTGLSTHELNQPGCYREVKDTSVVAQFKAINNEASSFLFNIPNPPKGFDNPEVFFLAWTTTPWTLPSNTALGVGPKIEYARVMTYNIYTGKPIVVILAKELLYSFFDKNNESLDLEDYQEGSKKIPFRVLDTFKGKKLINIRYEQLIPWHQPEDGDAFKVISGDFVTTEEGTGIVHLAPSFGADDFRAAGQNGIGALTLVDKQGKFIEGCETFSGRFVKNEYDPNLTENDPSVDVDIAVMLKKENKAFKIEKFVHSYPHCWRTDKPILYYPLDSWFVKTTAIKSRMIELNNTINWKPESTGTGRFGKWLENLVDWNLSRSRYWGTPLPVWVSENNEAIKCIGSVAELKKEINKAIEAGFMNNNPLENFSEGDFSDNNYNTFDLHRPLVDDIILVSDTGQKMYRETDLIDVWFDSGAMPYAQLHYPFENKEAFKSLYPADFIAEGVDQTRGWFFTLHAIAVILFDSVAYKNIVSNGLVLDKHGNKMSKRYGNAVDPFKTIEQYGSDPVRWYMITNAPPWENLKFDQQGIEEVTRKFFGTLYNTYNFFALYANIDNFTYSEDEIPIDERQEIDQWILSLLNTLIEDVKNNYENYEPTKAGRNIQHFVIENLSNWYVRLNRKRFWGGAYSKDKIAAYQTLYTSLETVALLASPIAPFYMDRLYSDLNMATKHAGHGSVHLSDFPEVNENFIDKELEKRMDLAQRISSMILSLRRKVSIKVRQPLNKIMIPVLDDTFKSRFEKVKQLVLNEVNVKTVEYISDTQGILIKKIKPDFKKLGPKYGKAVKQIAGEINKFTNDDIISLEKEGQYSIQSEGNNIIITLEDVEITSEDIPGWLVTNDGELTVALDINLTDELKEEGIARELVNRIQNIRKDKGFNVTDKISIALEKNNDLNNAINNFKDYICSQTLAKSIQFVDHINKNNAIFVELNGIKSHVEIEQIMDRA